MSKEKGVVRKFEKKGKARRAYISWQDNDDSSSSSSSKEDKEANLCLMENEDSETNSVSSNTSMNFENYSQLFDAFTETQEEANKLTLLSNRLKGLNNWLENKVKTLEEELSHLETDFENIEMIYKKSSCKCVDSSFCENFDSLQKKVHYLLKTVEKVFKGQSNFEIVPASQSFVFWQG